MKKPLSPAPVFTRTRYHRLKEAHLNACKTFKSQFEFDGEVLLTQQAGRLVDFFSPVFKSKTK